MRTPTLLLAAGLALAPPGLGALEQLTFQIEGASEVLEDSLKGASLTRRAREDEATTAQDLLAAAQADYRRLVTALYAQGYYSGAVSIEIDGREAASIPPLRAPEEIRQITVRIDPGPRFAFGRTEIGPLAAGTELPLAFSPGETAEVAAIRAASAAALEAHRQAGRAKVRIADQRITADHASRKLDAVLQIEPGPVLSFGDLSVSGANRVREDAIRRIAGLPRGETYDPDTLERVTERLRRTGAFRSVALREAELANADGTLDIAAQVSEEKRRRLGAGIESSSVEGLSVSAFWLHRNLFGGAERFRIEAEVAGIGGETGGVDYRLGARLSRPASLGPDIDGFTFFDLDSLEEPDYELLSFGVGSGLTWYVAPDLTVEGAVAYERAEQTGALGTRNYQLLSFPLSAELERRNDPLDATSGYYLSGEVAPFVGLDGIESGARVTLDARSYFGFGEEDRAVFALRGQLGSVIGPEAQDAPADYLFYSGGGGTVRGQPYQSLGVSDAAGSIGGRSFLGVQAELRVGVTGSIGAVGFLDGGYIGAEEFPDGSSGEWHAGAGVGLRYDTGIGPIRLDLATPVGEDGAGESLELYIGIGQAF